jgi:putative NADH-flavin reductase
VQASIEKGTEMRLFILGATGGIGRHLVRIGLEAGHEVTAFVRSPNKIVQRSPRLHVVQGDLFNVEQMSQSLIGHEAVLSAFGPTAIRSSSLRRKFGRALAQSLRKSNVKRVELVSAAFLFPHIGALAWVLTRTLFRQMAPDMAGMEREIMQNDFEWTVVRPPRLTNGSANRAYRVMDEDLPEGGRVISRAEVAEFMIGEAQHPAHIHHIVGVSR